MPAKIVPAAVTAVAGVPLPTMPLITVSVSPVSTSVSRPVGALPDRMTPLAAVCVSVEPASTLPTSLLATGASLAPLIVNVSVVVEVAPLPSFTV